MKFSLQKNTRQTEINRQKNMLIIIRLKLERNERHLYLAASVSIRAMRVTVTELFFCRDANGNDLDVKC